MTQKEYDTRESFSQFGEDAVIQAFLRDAAYKISKDQMSYPRDGFYVDIDAFHPTFLSNTHWLWNQGWSGINVDATPGIMEAFDAERPGDTNLHMAISDKDGELTFYSYGHSVLNTADVNSVDWSQNPVEVKVPCLTLKSLLDRHVPEGKVVNILSVDVEGNDLPVLQSNDWDKYRPDLVLAERHSHGIDDIVSSDLVEFMESAGYIMHAWTPPTIFF